MGSMGARVGADFMGAREGADCRYVAIQEGPRQRMLARVVAVVREPLELMALPLMVHLVARV